MADWDVISETPAAPKGREWEDAPAPRGAWEVVSETPSRAWEDAPSQFAKFMRSQTAPMSRLERFGAGIRDPLQGTAQLFSHLAPAPVERAVNAANNWLAAKTGLVAPLPEGGMDQATRLREAEIQARTPSSQWTRTTLDAQGRPSHQIEAGPGVDVFRLGGNALTSLLATELKAGSGVNALSRIGTAALQGGATGAAQPVTEGNFWSEKAKQIGLGAVAGGATAGAAEEAADLLTPTVRSTARTPAAIANEAGYVLPPSMASDEPGAVTNALAGLGGKIKTQQAASATNQEVTNGLAAKSLGLPKEATLTEDTFNKVRSRAGLAYKAIEGSGVPIKQDMEFVNDLLALGPKSEEMAKFFPKTARNDLIKDLQDEFGTGQTFSPQAGIQAVRRLRFKATSNLKSFDNPDKMELGFAQREAADAIDNLIDRNLTAAGRPELVRAYRDARTMLAKIHDVESATNTASGNVNAQALARLAARGRPLTGELKTIADTATAFPKAMQPVAAFGGNERYSALDAYGAILGAMHGHPAVVGAILGRPIARQLVLSRAMQDALTHPRVAPDPATLSTAGQVRNALAQMIRQGGQYAAPSTALGANALAKP